MSAPAITEATVVEYRMADAGVRVAIVEPDGQRRLRAVIMDAPLKVRRLPASEARYMQTLDYPLTRARKRFRAAGRTLGINRNARRFLRG